MAKSPEAFRTISEAADELDVPQHVLRHWEEAFGQVRPMRRAGGRRYYRPLDIDLLRGVRVLLYELRYTTKGVQKILKEHGVKYVAEIGRRRAVGDEFELLPAMDEDGGIAGKRGNGADDDVLELGADELVPSGLSQDVRKRLAGLLLRLESAQAALDEAVLALEAIAPDND